MNIYPRVAPWKAVFIAGMAIVFVFALAIFWQFVFCGSFSCHLTDHDFHHTEEEKWHIVIVATLAAASALLVLCPFALRMINERNRALEKVRRQAAASQESLSKELKHQNQRFDLALENLVQGVCMFDGEQRLIVSNLRYATMYGLPAELLQPGVTLREILEYRIANGLFAEGSPEAYINERMAWVTSGVRSTKIQQLTDGRCIEIVHQPMADGGWLTTHQDITQRTKADAALKAQYQELQSRDRALREQNERFDAALNNMNQGLCMYDKDQRLIVCNRRYIDMYGLTEERVRPGITLREILEQRIDIEDFGDRRQEEFIESTLAALPEQTSSHKTKLLRDGRTILISHCPMSNGGWLATHEDITDRKTSADLLRAVFDGFPGGIAAFDSDLVLRIANKNYYKVFDVPEDMFQVGTHIADIIRYYADQGHFGPGDPADQARARVAELASFRRHTVERRHPDGRVLEVEEFPLPEGRGLVVTCIDITDRKRVEEALRQSEELFSKAFHKSPIPLSISRPGGEIHDANEAFLSTLGYAREEVIGISALNLCIWADPRRRAEFVSLLKKNSSVTNFEAQYQTKDRTPLDMLISGEYVVVGGEPHMFNVSQDVTETNRAKRQLVEHRDHLQELVNEATAELKSKAERLEKSLAKEKELNELQRQFVSMASHEFRTPLAVIDGMVQRMIRRKDTLTSGDIEKRATKIRAAVHTITNLMESTLSAARMDAGAIEINKGECDLKAIIEEACARQRLIGKNQTIGCNLEELPGIISADSAAINQVFTNLLSNASKYSPEGTDIVVKGWSTGEMALVSVQDAGIGIDEDDIPKMFTRFFRAKTSTGIPGTGIGLNLVRNLVELHDGTISVTSKKGIGSTFTVCLPIGAKHDKKNRVEAA